MGLGQERPVPVAQREPPVGQAPDIGGRDDVQDRDLANHLGPIQRQAIGDPPAPVVAGDIEALEPQTGHQGDDIAGHGAFRIGLVILGRHRLGAFAVAAQVGRDHGEVTR